MSRETEKWLGAAFGFGAGIVWVAAGAGAALVCVVGAGLCAGAVIAREAGFVGWVAATATGVRKRVEARIPAQRPPRTIGRKQAPKPKTTATAPEAAPPKAAPPEAAGPRPERSATTQPKRRAEAPAPVVKPKPYDHDEQSGEHVYEVATYGW
jgi:hypothetical protein